MEKKTGTERTRQLYERHHFGDFSYGKKREEYNCPLTDFLKTVGRGDRVVDVGCGTAYWMDVAVRSGVPRERIVCVDLSSGSARAAREKGFQSLCADACRLGLADGAFNVTIANGVIHHTPEPLAAFRELVRVTKPGGQVFLCVYCRWNPYFYAVHRAGWPLRRAYWKWGEKVLDVVWPAARLLIIPAIRAAGGARVDEATARTLLMDQVITPYAHLFSRRALRRYADACGCELSDCRLTKWGLMWAAAFRVGEKRQDARSERGTG